jgi:hypothetical protein
MFSADQHLGYVYVDCYSMFNTESAVLYLTKCNICFEGSERTEIVIKKFSSEVYDSFSPYSAANID